MREALLSHLPPPRNALLNETGRRFMLLVARKDSGRSLAACGGASGRLASGMEGEQAGPVTPGFKLFTLFFAAPFQVKPIRLLPVAVRCNCNSLSLLAAWADVTIAIASGKVRGPACGGFCEIYPGRVLADVTSTYTTPAALITIVEPSLASIFGAWADEGRSRESFLRDRGS